MEEEKVNELIGECLKVIREVSELNMQAALSVKQLSRAADQQTKTFVMQIEKLSKRLDAAEVERQALLRITEDQNKRIDNLLRLLHDSITKQHPNNFIQQQ